FPLQAFELSEPTIWRTASGLMAGFEVVFLYNYVPRSQRYRREFPELFNRYSLVLTYSGGIFTLLLQSASAAGMVGTSYAAVFMVGLFWLLFHGSFQFG